MCLINGSNTRIGIVVSIHTKTEWFIIPRWCCFPMIAIMTKINGKRLLNLKLKVNKEQKKKKIFLPKAIHSFGDTFFFNSSFFITFAFLFPLTFFFKFASSLFCNIVFVDFTSSKKRRKKEGRKCEKNELV